MKNEFFYEKICRFVNFAYLCNRNQGGLAQLARALAWHARGHQFDPGILHKTESYESSSLFFLCMRLCPPAVSGCFDFGGVLPLRVAVIPSEAEGVVEESRRSSRREAVCAAPVRFRYVETFRLRCRSAQGDSKPVIPSGAEVVVEESRR